jgi:Mor family transcriptional regulator
MTRNDALYVEWQAGARAFELAAKYGVSRQRVQQILNARGVESVRHPLPERERTCLVCGQTYTGLYPAHMRTAQHPHHAGIAKMSPRTEAMAAEVAAGGDVREIAERYGVRPITVYRAANVSGVHRYGSLRPRKTAAAVEALRAGQPNWLVKERFGLSDVRVVQLRQRWCRAAS